MTRNLLFLLTLGLFCFACGNSSTENQPISNPEKKIEVPESPQSENPQKMQENKVQKGEFTSTDPTFAAMLEQYEILPLPHDFPDNSDQDSKKMIKKPLAADHISFLCGEGKVDCKGDEQPFAGYQFPVSESVVALVSYLPGDFSDRMVLSTHMASGEMIDQIDLMGIWEFETYRYSGRINSKNVIFRSTVITRLDENTQQEVREIDSEEKFKFDDQGKIVRQD